MTESAIPDILPINSALIAIMREVGAIGKERKNQGQGYNFRGIDDAMNALHHLFAKYGVLVTSKVLSHEREERQNKSGGLLIYSIIKFQFTFAALDGTTMTTETIGEGMDSGDKASNKSFSVALKYALFEMFLIPTKELLDSEIDDPAPLPRSGFNREKLPKTSPLAPGTFEPAKTVSDPSPANKIDPEASQSPSPATPATEPTITNWKDLPYTNGKGKTKKLGAMSETFLNDLHGYFESTKPSTKEHQLVKAGLAIRHGELHSNPVDKLFEWAKENKVDPAVLLAVAQRGLNSEAKDFFDMEQDAAQSLLDDPEKTLKAVQFELDDLPK